METAAAILVKTVFDSNQPLRNILSAHSNKSQQAAADYLAGWHAAVLTAIKKAHKDDPSPR